MKSLRQMLPYKLRRALLLSGIAGAAFVACSKQPEPQHDTTYVWGKTTRNLSEIIQKIGESSDSTQVRTVYIKCDGKDFAGGLSVSDLADVVNNLESKVTNKEKLSHGGDITRPAIRNKTAEEYAAQKADSIYLANKGYRIVNPIYTAAYSQ